MKRSYRGVIVLSLLLLASIVSTQQAVNSFYFEHYQKVIFFAILNVILFPIALWVYKVEKNKD